MNKNFDDWIILKENIHEKSQKPRFFKERQIWWCALGENIGTETNGKSEFFSRPVLIYKKLSQNTFVGLSMTSKDKSGSWYVPITQHKKETKVVLSQIRVMDEKRLYKLMGELDDKDWQRVVDGFKNLYCS
jgi:mRNA interferase MazF